jgi:D-alanyl-D-alanine dipeptidase
MRRRSLGAPAILSLLAALSVSAQAFHLSPRAAALQPGIARPVQTQDSSANPPPDVKPEWAPLIGDYGQTHNKIYVLERGGTLGILRAGGQFTPLRPVSADRYEIFERGRREQLIFQHLAQNNAQNTVTGLSLGGALFARNVETAPGHIFEITPLQPVAQLRREAMASQPPVEAGRFLKPDLVDLATLDPSIKLEIRYATSRNFLGAPLYLEGRAFLQRPAAEALVRVSNHLHTLGYGLLVYDAYRPWYVTKMFWDGTPDDKKIFVANPKAGSRHNRGCAVDLTLYDLKTGQPVQMTGGYDEMSERSYPTYPGGTSLERWHRDLLRQAMEAEGFRVQRFEWWHFDYRNWRQYPILNLSFEQLDRQKR